MSRYSKTKEKYLLTFYGIHDENHGPHPAYCHRVSTKFEYFFLTHRDAVAVIFN